MNDDRSSDVVASDLTVTRIECPHCANPYERTLSDHNQDSCCRFCGNPIEIGTDPAALWSPDELPELGKFRLLSAAGQGTYGTVYRALDTELDRVVAIKIPRGVWLSDDDNQSRFFREARSVAQLNHPGIVPVFEAGYSDGIHYLVAEYVDGTTLTDKIEKREFSFRETAELVAKVADALQHAHDHGVIHRDLKPSNIMIATDGAPRVMDFGLAKRTSGDATMTLEGQVIGTPAYMSPEQAAGEINRTDGRSDIYCLGVILYQLLTGELPFRGNQRMLIRQVIDDDPRQPSSLNDRVPRDLETICLKSMAKEMDRRYLSAAELAADLRRWLRDEPIQARPITRTMKAWRWIRRNRGTATLAASTTLLLIAISFVSTAWAITISRIAEKERRTAIVALQAQGREEAARIAAQNERDAAERARTTAMREQEIATHVSDFMVDLFQASDPIGLGGFGIRGIHDQSGSLSLAEMLDRATDRVRIDLKNQPRVQAKLMATLGNVHRSRGNLEQAKELIKTAHQQWIDHSGDELGRARIRYLLAWVNHDLGRLDESKQQYEEVLEIQERVLGREHLETAATLFNYAWLLADLCKATANRTNSSIHTEIQSLFREVLHTRRQQLGDGHRDVAVAMTGLLAALIGRGDVEEIKQLLVEALRIYHAQENGQQLGMAVSLFFTGAMARKNGRFEKAIMDYRKGIDISKEVLGNKHPLVAVALGELAGTLKQTGNLLEAEPAVLECLAIARAIAPSGHPQMIPALVELAEWRFENRDFQDCQRLDREAIEIWEHFRNGHDGNAFQAMLRLATLHWASGEFSAAIRLYQRVSEFDIPGGRGGDWIFPRQARLGLIRVSREQGDADRAIQMYQTILDDEFDGAFSIEGGNYEKYLHRATIGGLAGATIDHRGGLANSHTFKADNSVERIGKLIDSAIAHEHCEEPHEEIALAENLLDSARFRLAIGNVELATEHARRAIDIFQRRLPTTSWPLAAAKSTYGACLQAAGDVAAAQSLMVESNQVLESILGRNHGRTLESQHHLSQLSNK